MDTRDHGAPWGTTRMAPYAETDPVPPLTPVIDPETQIAVIIDEHGRTVELHNTSSSTSNSTSTSSADSSDSDNNSDSDHDY